MNIVLLNLTRFGDLLQSQAAIADLARQGHRLAVLCLENFTEAAALLSGVEQVHALPASALLASLTPKGREGAKRWPAALARLALLREKLDREFAPDLVCNLTPSLAARLLARYLAGERPCAGFIVDAHGFGVNTNAWAEFWQGASLSRGVSPFNVVDLFRKVADAGGDRQERPGDGSLRPPSPEALRRMQSRLAALAPEEGKGYVALQAGASAQCRRWPVESFAALGEILWREERLCPVLLGSGAEKDLARRYGDIAGHPFIPLCGETGLADLASALCACRLLVSNDTGTMHYAAGLSVPVLAVFLATAQAIDTGPYREGSCLVEPDLPCHPCAFGSSCSHMLPESPGTASAAPQGPCEACRLAVSPECVADLALSHLRRGVWREEGATRSCGARIWRCAYDEAGFMDLVSLSGHGGESRTLWFALQRHHIRQFLNRDPASAFAPRPLPESLRFPARDGAILREGLATASALVEVLSQQGRVLSARPLPMMRERFLASWNKVRACLGNTPFLGALALLWVQQTQAPDQALPEILLVAGQFRQLLEGMIADIA